MKKSTRKRIVRYSILTALALDAVGYALSSGYSIKEKTKWYASDRNMFPIHKLHKNKYGVGSANSAVFLDVFTALVDISPSTSQDAIKVMHRICEKFQVDDDLEVEDKGLYLPVSVAIGYYATLVSMSTEYMLFMIDIIYSSLIISQEEIEVSILISYFISRLCVSGFFGYHIIQEADELDIIKRLKPYCDYLMETHPDITRLKKINKSYTDDLSYSYKLLSYIVFYMLRVDTACSTGDIKSLPREQLLGILNIEGINEQDAGFIYGAICTASEHNHPLAPKPIRESIEFFNVVDDTLGKI